jgi:hypothetical protein
VPALLTLAAFLVAAPGLALRPQLLGLACFAVVLAIVAWRHRLPLALWLVPLIMVAWANVHGSFFVGWAALGLALLEDFLSRRRLTLVLAVVTGLSVVATLLTPFGFDAWVYVMELSSNPVVSALVSEWQATDLGSVDGLLFYSSVAAVLALLLYRGRVISWLQVLWLAGFVLLGLRAVRGVVWWALAATPVVSILVDGL